MCHKKSKLGFVGWLAWVAAALLTPLSCLAQKAEGERTVYVVRGPSTQNPNDQTWSTYCKDEDEARAVIKELMFDYYDPNGLLNTSTDKPVKGGLRPVALLIKASGETVELPPKGPPPSPELPRKIPAVPNVPAEKPKPPLELFGKRLRATIGKRSVTVTFKAQTFVATGGIKDAGQWEPLETGVHLTASTWEFYGYVKGDKLVGMRFFYDDRPAEEWTLESTVGPAKETGKPAPNASRRPSTPQR